MLISHIIVALSSICYSTYVFFRPSKSKVYAAYGLVGLTLGTGTYLIWHNRTHLLQTCLTGLTYTAVVSVAIIAAHRKLATPENKTQ